MSPSVNSHHRQRSSYIRTYTALNLYSIGSLPKSRCPHSYLLPPPPAWSSSSSSSSKNTILSLFIRQNPSYYSSLFEYIFYTDTFSIFRSLHWISFSYSPHSHKFQFIISSSFYISSPVPSFFFSFAHFIFFQYSSFLFHCEASHLNSPLFPSCCWPSYHPLHSSFFPPLDFKKVVFCSWSSECVLL